MALTKATGGLKALWSAEGQARAKAAKLPAKKPSGAVAAVQAPSSRCSNHGSQLPGAFSSSMNCTGEGLCFGVNCTTPKSKSGARLWKTPVRLQLCHYGFNDFT